MKRKGIKTIVAAAVFAAFLSPALSGYTIEAAPVTAKPKASINNVEAGGEVILRQGYTFVTLTDLKPLGDYKLRYDNPKKQVTLQGNGKTVVLTAGSRSMEINGVKQSLPAAPFLYQGKTLIPLWTVATAFGASIHWNGSLKTAYINNPSAELSADLKSSDLMTARNAAVKLPYASELGRPDLEMSPMEMQGVNFYFPKGKSDRFFLVNNDIAEYYEIHGGAKYLKWQAKLDYQANQTPASEKTLFFLPAVKAEQGQQPDAGDWTVATFIFRYPSGVTSYRLVNRTDEWAAGWVELDSRSSGYKGEIVTIPEE